MREFTGQEKEFIFDLAEKLTGASQKGSFRRDILLLNVQRRMSVIGTDSLPHYLNFAMSDDTEFDHLMSALTIHTTSWFREKPHLDRLNEYLSENWSTPSSWTKKMRFWCAASSTGEEVYSFGLVLESFRRMHPGFEYEVWGSDIDPVSVNKGKAAVYGKIHKIDIPNHLWFLLKEGKGKTENLFAIDQEIRKRTQFTTFDLTKTYTEDKKEILNHFDWIVCRNVLIYFSPENVAKIIRGLLSRLNDEGTLCLGHSEAIDARNFQVKSLSNSIYLKTEHLGASSASSRSNQSRALVIDDSESMRRVLKKALEREDFFVLTAQSADEADLILRDNKVDIITLDLNMPKVHGAEWLKNVRAKGLNTPVLVISDSSPSEAYEVLGALEKGAQDFIEKSTLNNKNADWPLKLKELISSHKNRETFDIKKSNQNEFVKSKFKLARPDVILIGASTGGTEALIQLLKHFNPDSPPVMVVQHIPSNFAKPFAERLSSVSGLKLGEFTSGEVLKTGHIYMATTDAHLGLKVAKDNLIVSISNSPLVSGHRPSVDYLYRSALAFQGKIMAVLLTGMGRDGARGMFELFKNGAMTLAQNEQSCVVFGMPKEAIALGGAGFVGDLREIRSQMDNALRLPKEATHSVKKAI